VVQPLAVVIELAHALVAHGAVLGAAGGCADVAQMAAPVLDHVAVLRPVEFWDDPVVAMHPPQFFVRRIRQQGRQMGGDVHQVEARDQTVQWALNAGMKGRNEHPVAGHSEQEEHQPAKKLKRMQWQLQSVEASSLPMLDIGDVVLIAH